MQATEFLITKIIATLGPASSDKKTIQKLIEAGARVFRINFSHGDFSNYNKLIENIFLAEGWMISIIGSIAGLIIGTTISWVQDHFGLLKLTGSGTFIIDAYPVDIQTPDLLMVWLTVLLIGFFAARYPVKQISKKYLKRLENEEIV